MARENAATLPAVLVATSTVYNNEIPNPSTTRSFTGFGTASASTRSDIVRSPPKVGFRKPLPYSAEGWSRSSAAMSVEVDTYSNAGKRRTNVKLAGTVGTNNGNAMLYAPILERLISDQERERLLVDLLKRTGDQKWSMGQAVVEGREAVTMIGSAARSLANALSHAVRKDWRGLARSLNTSPKKAGKHADDVASGWLAYSFGWTPLVDDITSAALFLGDLFDNDKLLIMSRGQLKRDTIVASSGTFAQTTGGSVVVTTSFEDREKTTSDLKMSLYYTVTSDKLYEMTRYGIIGASTPWAVMPMSFLVDWVLPIGDFLAALDARMGLTYQGGSYTHFDKCRRTRKLKSITAGKSTIRPGSLVLWSPVERFKMDRVVYRSNPVPVPLYVKDPFSVWKTVTSIALLKQFKS